MVTHSSNDDGRCSAVGKASDLLSFSRGFDSCDRRLPLFP